MQNGKPIASKNKITMVAAGCLAAILLIGSYFVALSEFVDSKPEEETSLVSTTVESSEGDEIASSEVYEESSTYKYYDSIRFESTPIQNSSVKNGTLAVINSDTGCPTVDQSEIVNIGLVKTESVYGLANMSLVLYEDAITNIDKFIVGFYEQVPRNGLIIAKGYTPADSIASSEPAIDLTTGYSVQFSIFNSSYKFSDDEFSYLKDQAYRYGIIQRYPENKENFTGHSADNTIYRYVGLAHSMYMNHYRISLEEYIDKIATQRVVEYESDLESGVSYVIYYVPVDDSTGTTYVQVPKGDEYSYTISGDGDSGFIVTVKVSK